MIKNWILFGLMSVPLLTHTDVAKGGGQRINDPSRYLLERGAFMASYALGDDLQMHAKALLCKKEKQCFPVSLEFDTGDLNNHVNAALKDELSLADGTKSLHKVSIGSLPAMLDFPIYFSDQSGRGSYLGASSIEKYGLWFNFGKREIYGGVRPGLMDDYVKQSQVRYTLSSLEDFGGYRYMSVSLNGRQPVNFLVDTGTSVSLIDKAYAEQIGLHIEDDRCEQGESQVGKSRVCYTSDVFSIRSGEHYFFASLPKGFLTMNLRFVIPPLQVKGILGLDWLERNAAIVSLKENKLYVPALRTYD